MMIGDPEVVIDEDVEADQPHRSHKLPCTLVDPPHDRTVFAGRIRTGCEIAMAYRGERQGVACAEVIALGTDRTEPAPAGE